MAYVYYNYPNSRVSIHSQPFCRFIQMMNKQEQRKCRIDAFTISAEFQKLINKRYLFQSKAELNDIWIEIDFENKDFEISVANYVLHILSQHYKPFAKSKLEIHC